MKNYIENILNGKSSNATAKFFSGEYFVKTVTAHSQFSELQQLYWDIETKLYSKLSKKTKARRSLVLTTFASGFFETPGGVVNNQLLALQQEILGDWAKVHYFFGVSIDWHKVCKDAYESGNVTKTNADFDKLVSLQDIPQY